MKSRFLVTFVFLSVPLVIGAAHFALGEQATAPRPDDSPPELPASSAIRCPVVPKSMDEALGSLVYSPDGALIAARSVRKVQVFDARNGRIGATIRTISGGPVAFTPSGKQLAIPIAPGEWGLFDPATGRMLRSLEAHSGMTVRNGSRAVAFSRDGKKLAAAYDTGDVVIWNVDSGKRLKVLPPYIIPGWGTPPASPRNPVYPARPAPVESLAFSPDGSTLYTAGHILRAWDLATKAEPRVLDLPEKFPCYVLALSPDGSTIAAITGSRGRYAATRRIFLLDAKSGTKRAEIPTVEDVMDIAFRPGGKELVSLEGKRILRLWDTATAKPIAACQFENHFWLTHLAVSPDGRHIAAAGQESDPIFGAIGMVKTEGPTLGPWLPEP